MREEIAKTEMLTDGRMNGWMDEWMDGRISLSISQGRLGENEKVGAYAMKRVAAGAHLRNPWLFETAKRPDDQADYCLGTRRWGRLLPEYQTIEPTTA